MLLAEEGRGDYYIHSPRGRGRLKRNVFVSLSKHDGKDIVWGRRCTDFGRPGPHSSCCNNGRIRSRQYNLRLSRSKCDFSVTQISILGHVVSANGIEPDVATLRSLFPV